MTDLSEVRAADLRLAATTDSIPAFIAYIDADLIYRFCNQRFEEWFGVPRTQIVGMSMRQLLGDATFDQLAPHLDRALKGERSGYAQWLEFPQGRRFMRASYIPAFDANGRVEGLNAIIADETEVQLAEEAVRQGEMQYRQIAEGLPQMVWSANPDGIRDYFNSRWLEYTGIGLSESEHPWRDVLHPEDREHALREWASSVATGEAFESEYRIRSKEGRYHWFLGRATALRNELGEIARWFGTCTDIDEHKNARRVLEITNQFAQTLAADLDLERIVQALTDASTLAVGAQFGSFFYTVVNEAGESLLLYALSGAPIESFARFGIPRATELFGPTFTAEGVVRSDDIVKDPRYGKMAPHYGMPEGHLPVASYLAVPVVSRSGVTIGGLFFGHADRCQFTKEHEGIVASFAAQAAVAMDNARLYERVAGMNEELERQVRERTVDLQTANEALRGFTYHVSHDLRAPLRTIASASRIVQEDFGDSLSVEAHILLDRQAEAAGKLGRLIDDLLKLSRLSQADIEKTSLDLTAIARDASREALSSHPASSVEIIVEDGLTGKADANLIRLALGNLIENAVKYSPKGGMVRVGRTPDGEFFVSDEGIGIDPRYFDKVFEPFQRLHTDAEFAGTGIGLSNVKQVIERHGGKVWLTSEPGNGSTFLFTLG